MPDIRPFKGFLYNSQKIKDFASVVTEPYDVISPHQQAAYHKVHPYNIIRLILGKHNRGDTSKNNQYTRAAKRFADWQKRDILVRDEKENIYIYAQTFPHNGRRRTRTGFMVLLKLEDFAKSAILPHENTFSKPVQDRLRLLKRVRANLSPIFAMFTDSQGKINNLLSQHKRNHRPYIVAEVDKVLHRLWRMSDKRKIATIKKLLKDKQIFIADGHHRYEAALNYKMQMQKKKKRIQRQAPSNYVMTYLVATADPGLTILPTYRVLRIEAPFKRQEIMRNLRKSFEVVQFSTSEQLFSYMRENKGACVFSAYFRKNKFYGLKFKQAKARKDLDVTILHSFIIEHILNIGPFEENIYYTRDAQEAIKLVDKGRYQVVFFLRAPSLKQIKRVAMAGERMPHKTTYFYPKLITGLVINKFNEDKS